ncbi:hypothetical protein L2E82_32264 [Cichorium intybus]|uniref:Uncharacterized protein n=1 Tax=Cichorium intybus TaxID=13427 RepID=A0ACB9BGQ8_CICIN|nr:hypothetical protein L2E82_32264 [Cichorium intybus]
MDVTQNNTDTNSTMCSSRQTRKFRKRKRGVSAYEEIGGRKGESKNNVNLIGLTPKVIPLRNNSKSISGVATNWYRCGLSISF